MLQFLFYKILKIRGWKFKIEIPTSVNAFVMIGVPHTSNWDFVPAMAVKYCLRHFQSHFIIKDSVTKAPFIGWIVRSLGGMGIDRQGIANKEIENSTELMAKFFEQKQRLVLMIAPEGTRKKVKQWRTGFYYIAKKAKVPIALAYADYKNKEVGLFKFLIPENFEKDMKEIMNFYQNIQGCNPQNQSLDQRFSPKP